MAELKIPKKYNTTLCLMVRAAELIRDPKHWLQNKLSDRHGSYCSIGALNKVRRAEGRSAEQHELAVSALQQTIGQFHYPTSVELFNDSNTHERVMHVWDATIARLKKKQQVSS